MKLSMGQGQLLKTLKIPACNIPFARRGETFALQLGLTCCIINILQRHYADPMLMKSTKSKIANQKELKGPVAASKEGRNQSRRPPANRPVCCGRKWN